MYSVNCSLSKNCSYPGYWHMHCAFPPQVALVYHSPFRGSTSAHPPELGSPDLQFWNPVSMESPFHHLWPKLLVAGSPLRVLVSMK